MIKSALYPKTVVKPASIKKANTKKISKAITSEKSIPKNGQTRWDELLATPESDALLTLLVAQAQREEQNGNFDEEAW
jgi:hypothetical protein